MSAQRHATILNVKIDSTSASSVLRFVQAKISKKEKFFIVTPNPEIILKAQTDENLKKILNSASISITDGIGIVAAQKFLNLPTPKEPLLKIMTLIVQGIGVGASIFFDKKWLVSDLEVIKGRELFSELMKLANKKSWRVFLLGGERDEADGTKKELEKVFKGVKIKSSPGPLLNNDGLPKTKEDGNLEKEVLDKINDFKPHLLFVGFGAPKQEKWLYRWFSRLEIGGAMVVGGTFDYISGKRDLPPKWMDEMGLEWLWRILTGSQNWGRIKVAVIDFPLKIFLEKFYKD